MNKIAMINKFIIDEKNDINLIMNNNLHVNNDDEKNDENKKKLENEKFKNIKIIKENER